MCPGAKVTTTAMAIFWEGRYASVAPSPLRSGFCRSQDPEARNAEAEVVCVHLRETLGLTDGLLVAEAEQIRSSHGFVAGSRQKCAGADLDCGLGHVVDVRLVRSDRRAPLRVPERRLFIERARRRDPERHPALGAERVQDRARYRGGLGAGGVGQAHRVQHLWRKSVPSGLWPIMDRISPRIMKLVCE